MRKVKRTQMIATARFTIRVFVTLSDRGGSWRGSDWGDRHFQNLRK